MRFLTINFFCLLAILCSINVKGQDISFVHRVFEYKPAPGQFINTVFGFPYASQSIIGEMRGGVSLGAFGGYIVVGFEKPIENDVNNPYGIDFTIFGNANQSSNEPAIVYVMKDENNNGLPDDSWYQLAGSDHWFSTSMSNYEITYHNPGGLTANDILWEDNQGNKGTIPANEFHEQTYYPLRDSFPDISADKYILKGAKINDRLDRSTLDYVTSFRYPFGYADNLSRNNAYSGWEPDNPYTFEIEGTGGDGFDINWAVDADNNYIELDNIDFIKVQTGVNGLAGWLGEISSEVLGILDVEPNINLMGEDRLLIIEPVNQNIEQGKSLELNAFAFKKGLLQQNENIIWFSNNSEVASINEIGVLEALEVGSCYIYAKWQMHSEIIDSIKVNVVISTSISQKHVNRKLVYPNPVDDLLYVIEPASYSNYNIFDRAGKVVIQSNLYGNQISLQGLQPGFYYLELKGKGIRCSIKIIKN